MTIEFESLEAAIANVDGTKHLLAGNGLSMAYDRDIFSYSSLLNTADFSNSFPIIDDIFKRLETTDFEKVASSLYFSASVAEAFGENQHAEKINQTIDFLKKSLIEAVKKNHPSDRNQLSDNRVSNFQLFLRNFLDSKGNLYCLNYDILAYWGVLRVIDNNRLSVSDGFGTHDDDYVAFHGDSSARKINILSPHGTLFFFEDSGNVLKPRSTNNNKMIIDIISDNLEKGNFPLFVSEGTKEKKYERIRNNHYLNYCFESIGNCEGSFFIYGHSLDIVSDGHILEKISSNQNIKKIYASYFGGETEKSHITTQLLKIKEHSGRKDLEVGIYPANSVTCW
ncbi:DUF4917 family protein [Ochrobactrum sp. GPK 3]